MTDRIELLEATLDSFPEGVALLGENCQVVFWNQAAQAITGYAAMELIGRSAPETLQPLLQCAGCTGNSESGACNALGPANGHRFLVHARHKLGNEISAMARLLMLRDGLGTRIGKAIFFHPAECLDALPHGATGEDEGVEASLDDLKERLEMLFEDFANGGPAFGVLWITVDQAHDLRRTHGAGACEAMLKKVERALMQGLRPAEHLGRWGEDEFLVISHEHTAALLANHAQVLAGFSRTADFRWWGDRVSLTVSIGAAQAESAASLADLLERARDAMFSSCHAGGNHITAAPGGNSCSQL
jgi:diguanylate cyclase (GGDEF)-like protein/PAS domain S-box-containing protein